MSEPVADTSTVLAVGGRPVPHWAVVLPDGRFSGAVFGPTPWTEVLPLLQHWRTSAVLLPRGIGLSASAFRALMYLEGGLLVLGWPLRVGTVPRVHAEVCAGVPSLPSELAEACWMLQQYRTGAVTFEPGFRFQTREERHEQRRSDRYDHGRVLGMVAAGATVRAQLSPLGYSTTQAATICNELEAEGLLEQLRRPGHAAMLKLSRAGAELLSTLDVGELPIVPEHREPARVPKRTRVKLRAFGAKLDITSEQYRLLYALRTEPNVERAAMGLGRSLGWANQSVRLFARLGYITREGTGPVAVRPDLELRQLPARYT